MLQTVYTKEDVAKHCHPDDCWVILFDEVFDITNFMKHEHTGGMFPLDAAGTDASALFASSHPLNTRKYLLTRAFCDKYYKGRLAASSDSQPWLIYEDPFLVDVKREVEMYLYKNAMKPRDTMWIYLHTFMLFALYIASMIPAFYFGNMWGVPLHTLCMAVFSFNVMHSLNHGGLTIKRSLLRWLYPISSITMNSNAIWRFTHNLGHHIGTNCDKEDDDIMHAPILRLNEKDPQKWYYAYQHVYAYVLFSFVYVLWVLRHAVQTLTHSRMTPQERWGYYGGLGAACVAYIALPTYLFGFSTALSYFLAYLMLNGLVAGVIFSINHTSIEAEQNSTRRWGENQVRATVNWCSGSRIANFLSGGLNHQIEHHLFPSIHPMYYPYLSPIVQKQCKEHGLTYKTYGFIEALQKQYAFLKSMGSTK